MTEPQHIEALHKANSVRTARAVLKRQIKAGEVKLHAWFYDVGSAELFDWDELSGSWHLLGTRAPPLRPPHQPTGARNELEPKRPRLDA